MQNKNKLYNTDVSSEREFTLRVVLLSFVLTVILAASNCFLALKIGFLTSASIPAAILSMGILKLFKNASIFENNLVQTSASAGEAIAGGIAYTAPALILVHYWDGFDYIKTFLLALTGGVLGVLFSTPLRRFLVNEKKLTFPEGKAIAEVLKAGSQKSIGLKEILWGGSVGGILELMQSGFQIIANNIQYWFFVGKNLFGFGLGFSATLVGAGYLMGFQIALSLFVGALLGFGIGIPWVTHLHPFFMQESHTTLLATQIWQEKIRYIGIGTMLSAGLWTLLILFIAFIKNINNTIQRTFNESFHFKNTPATEKDIPLAYIVAGTFCMLLILFWTFQSSINLSVLGISTFWQTPFIITSLLYILLLGFIFSAICGYFSGLVGVSATPGSAIVIAGFLLTGTILKALQEIHPVISEQQTSEYIAITILIGCVITGISAIANDNIQDLKTGHLIGATPWKQQVMLLFGAIISALLIPFIMQLLFSVYGIGDVLPKPFMDATHALSAPPAMMMATLSESVFRDQLPWGYMGIGAALTLFFIVINRYFLRQKPLSLLGIGIGIYLPITTTTPLFIGGFFSFLVKRCLRKKGHHKSDQKPVLFACGLVSGAAVMNVILAFPFAITQNLNVLRIVPNSFPAFIPILLGFLSLIGLGAWFYRMVAR
jgi:putative OPT family oligopeptide transporter